MVESGLCDTCFQSLITVQCTVIKDCTLIRDIRVALVSIISCLFFFMLETTEWIRTQRILIFIQYVFFQGTQFSLFVGVFVVSAAFYSFLFWKVLVPRFEGLSKSDAWRSFSTSIIGPCIVGDPSSRFIFFSSFVSVFGFFCFQGILWTQLKRVKESDLT